MKRYVLLILIATFLYSCNSSINAGDLYGKWKYIKVEKPHAYPPDSVSTSELRAQAPYIQFSKDNLYVIIWGGTPLSHGKFSLDGKNILITEVLADGSTRQFPFWVMSLKDKEIIFETKGDDGSRVTAVKE